MCLLIVFGFGIIFACRIPGLRRMPPPPNVDSGLFEQWKVLELRSIYVFLAATWGLTALLTLIGLLIAIFAGQTADADERQAMMIGIGVVADIGPLIWAAVLSSKAAKLKKQFQTLAPSYYPRPGQQLLQQAPLPWPEAPKEPDPERESRP